MYEDFTLTATHTIEGFNWTQHDQPLTYLNTTLTVFKRYPLARYPNLLGEHRCYKDSKRQRCALRQLQWV